MPTLPSSCLSDLTLDRLVAGDADRSAYAEHLEGCERCRTRLARFQEVHEASRGTVERLARQAMASPARGPARAWLSGWRLALAGSAALACAGALAMLARPPPEEGATRLKGDTIRFFRQRDGRVAACASGDEFRKGDALRFVVTSSESSQLLLVGIEASGKLSVYYPFQGVRSASIPAGTEVTLPGSIVLDDSPNDEFLLALFHSEPVAAAEVERALFALRKEPPLDLARLRELRLPGRHHWLVLRKQR